ncbi:MAG TPA: DedA family protein, partial [Gemmatimonadales bacterium]|nr:DedA family protein [Gemmatimonadales bacterium]
VNRLAELPPVAVYGAIALMAAIENIFPPFPADTAIAFGAFLSHRGVTEPWLVFAVTLVANIAGAMAMYWLASRHAAALFRSRLARRFFPEDGVVRVRAQYQRLGLPALFAGRLLPGFRAVVAPFAGLMHIGPVKVGLLMTLASAIWYGGLVFLASQLGYRFDDILALIRNLNRGLALVALVLAVALVAWLVVRRRRRRIIAQVAAREDESP